MGGLVAGPQEPWLRGWQAQSWGSPGFAGQAALASPDGLPSVPPTPGHASRGPRSQPHVAALLHGAYGCSDACSPSPPPPWLCLSFLWEDSPCGLLTGAQPPASSAPSTDSHGQRSAVLSSLSALKPSAAPRPLPGSVPSCGFLELLSSSSRFPPSWPSLVPCSDAREPSSLIHPFKSFLCRLQSRSESSMVPQRLGPQPGLGGLG